MSGLAIVMNMFYTGVGIARSLGEQGIRVIGLTSHRITYGNYTRYAHIRLCPSSREEPEALLKFLLQLGQELRDPALIFPTRDDDLVFLHHFRTQLSNRFVLLLPRGAALEACLNKWKTHAWAHVAGIPTPRSWNVCDRDDLVRIAPEVSYPCVLKPTSAHLWRKAGNWEQVGRRKAVAIFSAEELLSTYDDIARADQRVVIQERVSGADNCLYVAGCYIDRHGHFADGFTARKLLQVPESLGTGCIVQAVDRPDLLVMAKELLQKMQFTGIAEVEFKWDDHCGQYKLIEINARPWDQHRLGGACGVDLIYMAYCDLMGLPLPRPVRQKAITNKARIDKRTNKWIAEDVFALTILQSLWKGKGNVRFLLRLALGKRTYAVWSARDPFPFIALVTLQLGPELVRGLLRLVTSVIRRISAKKNSGQKGLSCENSLARAKCKN